MLTLRKTEGLEETLPPASAATRFQPFGSPDQTMSDCPELLQLQSLLRSMGENILDSLENQLDILQEEFIAQLSVELEARGIHIDGRLHLSLSGDGTMILEGEEKDTDRMQEILSESIVLQESFKELARLALLTHGITVACAADQATTNGDLGEKPEIFSHYHAYIKGSLSHFYIR